jgi:hypothetical protein
MAAMPRHASVLALLFGFAGGLFAQDCTQTLPAIFLNEQTREAVTAITADRLHAKVGKVLLPVISVEPIPSFRVLILIDTSGSMDAHVPLFNQRRALETTNQALDELLDQLPPGVQIEYGAFNQGAVFGAEFTADAQELRRSKAESIERTKRHGERSTALYDAVQQGLEHFYSVQPGDSILILTDGGDNLSESKPEKIQEEAAKKGVRLFTILFTGNNHVSAPTEESPATMFDFAEHTGGSVHTLDVSQGIWGDAKGREKQKQELRRFWSNEVLSGYVLRFKLPTNVKKQRKWILRVDRLPDQKYKIVAAYPNRLSPCPQTRAALP